MLFWRLHESKVCEYDASVVVFAIVLTEEMGGAPEGLSLGGEGGESDHGCGESVHCVGFDSMY